MKVKLLKRQKMTLTEEEKGKIILGSIVFTQTATYRRAKAHFQQECGKLEDTGLKLNKEIIRDGSNINNKTRYWFCERTLAIKMEFYELITTNKDDQSATSVEEETDRPEEVREEMESMEGFEKILKNFNLN